MPHSDMSSAAASCRAWPFEEARKLIKRYEKTGYPETVLFETGYGPSGLPHIGTFGEVARTSMVRHAFRLLTQDKVKTKLLCFSDDMDGLRKVPDNVPNREAMAAYIGLPLSRIPDPFGAKGADGAPLSFGGANNARLRTFLDKFGFDYEFASASDYYQSGRFDATLLKMLASYDKIMAIILPTLGEERRATYAPFLPISESSGKVLQVPLKPDAKAGAVSYIEPETGETITTAITGGKVKCQWKADWAMRWAALGVDYEMAGKDLIDSVNLSSKICARLGGTPPEGFNYELFLDEQGSKISKSKGNGLTIEDWLKYAPTESLALYMYQKPKTAKRLYFDVIPKAVDEYFTFLAAYPSQDAAAKLNNPVWHIHNGKPPQINLPVSFALLLNLVSASNAENEAVLWGFIERYAQKAGAAIGAAERAALNGLVACALNYYADFVKPNKKFRAPDSVERQVLADIKAALDPVNLIKQYTKNVSSYYRDYSYWGSLEKIRSELKLSSLSFKEFREDCINIILDKSEYTHSITTSNKYLKKIKEIKVVYKNNDNCDMNDEFYSLNIKGQFSRMPEYVLESNKDVISKLYKLLYLVNYLPKGNYKRQSNGFQNDNKVYDIMRIFALLEIKKLYKQLEKEYKPDSQQIQNALLNVARGVERYQDLGKTQADGRPGVSVAFFQMLYEVLLGQEKGPRFGSFIALYGIDETLKLIDAALNGNLAE